MRKSMLTRLLLGLALGAGRAHRFVPCRKPLYCRPGCGSGRWVKVVYAKQDDTIMDIARRYGVGYDRSSRPILA